MDSEAQPDSTSLLERLVYAFAMGQPPILVRYTTRFKVHARLSGATHLIVRLSEATQSTVNLQMVSLSTQLPLSDAYGNLHKVDLGTLFLFLRTCEACWEEGQIVGCGPQSASSIRRRTARITIEEVLRVTNRAATAK